MIVTGIYDLELLEPRGRPTRSYLDSPGAKWLLSSDVPLVVFAPDHLQRHIEAQRPAYAQTFWHDTGQLPEGPSEDAIARSKFQWNPLKDTPNYFALMRQKITWLRRAAVFAGKPVTWVDIALPGHLPGRPWDLLTGDASRIKLAELSHVPREARRSRQHYYCDHYWPVAGGVIRGSPADLTWLDEQVEAEWQWCLENEYAATDEMMLGWIRLQHPERFDTYYADHPTLVHNFNGVTESQSLITQMALRAVDDGFEEEARARFEAVSLAHLARELRSNEKR